MKQKIHPQFYQDAQVSCSCGNSFITGSTQKQITVEVCYKCHPFYTGEHRYLDTKGLVDVFQRKQEIAKKLQKERMSRKKKKTIKKEHKVKTLKELLGEI